MGYKSPHIFIGEDWDNTVSHQEERKRIHYPTTQGAALDTPWPHWLGSHASVCVCAHACMPMCVCTCVCCVCVPICLSDPQSCLIIFFLLTAPSQQRSHGCIKWSPEALCRRIRGALSGDTLNCNRLIVHETQGGIPCFPSTLHKRSFPSCETAGGLL